MILFVQQIQKLEVNNSHHVSYALLTTHILYPSFIFPVCEHSRHPFVLSILRPALQSPKFFPASCAAFNICSCVFQLRNNVSDRPALTPLLFSRRTTHDAHIGTVSHCPVPLSLRTMYATLPSAHFPRCLANLPCGLLATYPRTIPPRHRDRSPSCSCTSSTPAAPPSCICDSPSSPTSSPPLRAGPDDYLPRDEVGSPAAAPRVVDVADGSCVAGGACPR